MILISICLLVTPGIIALKICYRLIRKEIITIKNSISDYAVVSFIIFLLVNMLLFFTNRDRTVNFSLNDTITINNIYQTGFVFKYSLSSLIFSAITGIAYAFCKMDPILLMREIKKELKTEKIEENSSETKIIM